MRYRKLLISGQLLIHIFTKGFDNKVRCLDGLPPGCKFVYSLPNGIYGIWLVVEHSSFDKLKDGDPIPEQVRPIMEQVND